MAIQDPRFVPAYTVPEAAHYLRIPRTTVRAWVRGTTYSTRGQKRRFKPLIELPDATCGELSFVNLVEVHVLDALRRRHSIQLQNVRKALAFLKKEFPSEHPLALEEFETDGVDLFVEKYGQLINASGSGQTELRNLISTHLTRIDHDKDGLAERLFPFVRSGYDNQPTPIVIDPRISFGRPVIKGTGAPTAVIAERYKAGESISELSRDYGCRPELIEEAVRCELELDAA